jgi:nitroreductase
MDIDRRRLLGSAPGFGAWAMAGAPAYAAQWTYQEAVRSARAPLQATPRDRELVRFATLPANSHNTQPWIFTAGTDAIIIAPDFTRRCPAVDPDDHHLFVSLGCAAENLVVAASALGLGATPRFDNERIVIHIEPGGERRPDIVMRFGAGPDLPRSLRRPPEQVMHP